MSRLADRCQLRLARPKLISRMTREVFTLLCLAVVIPAAAQTIGSCPVFAANNVWNARIDTLPVHPKSSAYVNSIGPTSTSHADFGSGLWQGAPIGIPFVTVPGSQPKVPVSFLYASESDPGPYPIPPTVPIEGGSSSTGDRHIEVIDQTNCILYELSGAYLQPNGSWTGVAGAVFDLKANNLRPATWTSADAAGLPIFPGLARYDEVAAGVIKHALRFTAPQTQKAFIWPGRHQASSITDPNYPPMGVRFRLKASFNVGSFSTQTQVLLRAMQQYGMFLADNGTAWYVGGAPDERWDNNQLHEFGQLHGTDFEAVDESSLMVDPNSAAVSGGSTPGVLTLSQTSLNFGYSGSMVTSTQTVALAFNGVSGASWTASSNQPNITVSPAAMLVRLRCQFRGVFVAENANGLLKLLDLERLLQNGHRSARQNPIQHFAVGITGDDNDRQFRIRFLRGIVNVVRRAVRQFQIEKEQIEFLFFERGHRFFDGADNHAAETDFLEENFKQALETFVVIDHEHGRLSRLVFL